MSIPSHTVDSSSPPESFFPIDEETNKRYHPHSNPNNLRTGCEYCYKTKVSRYCDRHVLGRDLTTGKIIYDVTCGTCFHAKQVCYYKQKGRPDRPRTRVAALDRFQELLEAGQDARDADRRYAQSEGRRTIVPATSPCQSPFPCPRRQCLPPVFPTLKGASALTRLSAALRVLALSIRPVSPCITLMDFLGRRRPPPMLSHGPLQSLANPLAIKRC